MKCPKCQYENPDNKKYCRKCGADLLYHCPQCGSEVLADDLFCGDCKYDLLKDKPKPDIDYAQPQSYTPKHLADKILTSRSSLEGERKIVTVLFADVANYTSLSEKLDPEEVHQIMDGAFIILMDVIHKHEGTINQFTGDGIMALFGAPVAHENHAQRACYAALAIQKALKSYSEKIKKECQIKFKMRIGLNSGPVIIGAIGDDLRMDYTAVGDTTNLASRMESIAEPGNVTLTKNTFKIVKDFFCFEPLGKIEIKGKEEEQETYRLIKAGEIETRIEASVAKGLTRFVGRHNSMATFMEVYNWVKSGTGQILGIVGEAGVGKSRLLLEFRNRIMNENHIYLEGHCLHYGGGMAYLPFLDILKSYFNIKEGDREYIIQKKIKETISSLDENLNTIITALQELLLITPDDETFKKLEPQKKREKTFEALRDLFIRISQKSPFILTIEDLQWMDKTSEEFLNYLVGWIPNTPIMIILLYRPEYIHQWGSKSYYTKIGLSHLGKASSAELIHAILEDGDVAPELKNLILSRSEGNPLFMEELTHTLIENGSIQRKDDRFILRTKPENIKVPETIQDIIAARMDRLEENLKRTMQVASVIGRDFAFQILQTITGMKEDLKSYLINLQGLEFIYEKRLFPELEYIFKHALTQEVAYNSLLLKRRKQIHETIGKAIEEIYCERLKEFYEMLAYHYSKSDNLEKSYLYLKLSGEKAFGNYANQESYNFFLKSIEMLKRLPNTEGNKKAIIEICILIFAPMALLGFPEGSLDILQNGEKLAKEVEDKKNLTLIYGQMSLYYNLKDKVLESTRYIEQQFIEAKNAKDVELMVLLSSTLPFAYYNFGEFVKSLEIGSDVIAMLEMAGRESDFFGFPTNPYSLLSFSCGIALVMTGNFEESELMIKKGLLLAYEVNDIITTGLCEMAYGVNYIEKGCGENAIRHLQKALKCYEKSNWEFLTCDCCITLGIANLWIGKFAHAGKYVERALSIYSNNLDIREEPIINILLINFYHHSGEYIKATHYAKLAIELSKKKNERANEAYSTVLLGRILGKKDMPKNKNAEKFILQGIKILNNLKVRPWLSQGYFFLGELYADTGRKDEAILYLNKALSMCQDMGIQYWPDKIREVSNRL